MKCKGFKGAGKILVGIPVKEYKKIPNYFFIEIDLSTIEKREKELKKQQEKNK